MQQKKPGFLITGDDSVPIQRDATRASKKKCKIIEKPTATVCEMQHKLHYTEHSHLVIADFPHGT